MGGLSELWGKLTAKWTGSSMMYRALYVVIIIVLVILLLWVLGVTGPYKSTLGRLPLLSPFVGAAGGDLFGLTSSVTSAFRGGKLGAMERLRGFDTCPGTVTDASTMQAASEEFNALQQVGALHLSQVGGQSAMDMNLATAEAGFGSGSSAYD